MADVSTNPSRPNEIPWPATLCIFVSLLALALTEVNTMKVVNYRADPTFTTVKAIIPMFLSALAIIVSKFCAQRISSTGSVIWIVRATVYALGFFYGVAVTANIQSAYYMNFLARLFGYCFVLESALQHWLHRDDSRERDGFLVFLPAIIFVLASRTSLTHYIKLLTPLFAVLLILAMRASRPREQRVETGAPLWIAPLLIAVLMGGMMSLLISNNSTALSRIVMSLVRTKTNEDFSDVNTHPVLGRSLPSTLSQKRVLKLEGRLQEHHMRGLAFDIYLINGAWAPSSDSRSFFDAGFLKALPGGERLTVTPLAENPPVLYVPLHMTGVDAPDHKVQWSDLWNSAILAAPRRPGATPSYQITVASETHEGPLVRATSDRLFKRSLELPESIDPKFKELARTIAGTLTEPRDKMEAVRRYLWSNHSYSLNIEPGLGDPTVSFLLNKLDGHCQYFASATVLLLRAMDVPARYITGYYVHESPEPNEWIMRQRDSHAWTEVWLESEGWATFDTTPSSGMPGQAGRVSTWARIMENVTDWAESFGNWVRAAPVRSIALNVLGVILSVYAIYKLRRWRSRIRAQRPTELYQSPSPEFENIAESFDRYLDKCGIPCPLSTPWPEHLQRAQTRIQTENGAPPPQVKWDEANRFARQYSAARFSGLDSDTAVPALRQLLKELAA